MSESNTMVAESDGKNVTFEFPSIKDAVAVSTVKLPVPLLRIMINQPPSRVAGFGKVNVPAPPFQT